MTKEFAHPALSTILGLDRGKTIHYRGLKYASLKHPFSEPLLFTSVRGSRVDATSYGPECPQNPAARDHEFTFIQCALPCEERHFSITECLNLNIVTPKNLQHLVPVFVFIHGGGFSIGANSWPQYDPTRLVELSVEEGSPVIGINISYRLGAFGFLASQKLLAAGIKTNNGLRDQRVALTWIKNYIDGFGGDPNNISVVGVSTGAISCLLHLESAQPLFKRIFAMGGTPLLLKPLPLEVTESTYAAAIDKLGFASMTTEERAKALKEVAPDILLAATANLPMMPVIDRELITVPATFSQWSFKDKLLPGTEWCESIMMGDCEMDSSVLFYMLHDRIEGMEKAFITSTERSLGGSPTRQQLLESYSFLSDSTNGPTEAVNKILHFANDIGFYAPLVSIASGWPGKGYVFHFNEPNPWPGRYQGVATHILDAAFLFQNYNDFLDDVQKSSARAFGEHFIEFVNGSEPFPSYIAEDGGAMVYGPGGKRQEFVKSKSNEDYGRRRTIFKLAESSGFETLSDAWGVFLTGE
ncbi:alpha/beta-hydrolase [Stipitochalara longipes BDJ]|nr:alpha/beta-hydrolase [Stipitochalara longipes BDJ]